MTEMSSTPPTIVDEAPSSPAAAAVSPDVASPSSPSAISKVSALMQHGYVKLTMVNVGFFLHFAGLATNALFARDMYMTNHMNWFGLTIAIMILPNLVFLGLQILKPKYEEFPCRSNAAAFYCALTATISRALWEWRVAMTTNLDMTKEGKTTLSWCQFQIAKFVAETMPMQLLQLFILLHTIQSQLDDTADEKENIYFIIAPIIISALVMSVTSVTMLSQFQSTFYNSSATSIADELPMWKKVYFHILVVGCSFYCRTLTLAAFAYVFGGYMFLVWFGSWPFFGYFFCMMGGRLDMERLCFGGFIETISGVLSLSESIQAHNAGHVIAPPRLFVCFWSMLLSAVSAGYAVDTVGRACGIAGAVCGCLCLLSSLFFGFVIHM